MSLSLSLSFPSSSLVIKNVFRTPSRKLSSQPLRRYESPDPVNPSGGVLAVAGLHMMMPFIKRFVLKQQGPKIETAEPVTMPCLTRYQHWAITGAIMSTTVDGTEQDGNGKQRGPASKKAKTTPTKTHPSAKADPSDKADPTPPTVGTKRPRSEKVGKTDENENEDENEEEEEEEDEE